MSKYPDFLQNDLDAFLQAQNDPSKEMVLDCLMNELEGSIKAAASFGTITNEEAEELLYKYLYEREC